MRLLELIYMDSSRESIIEKRWAEIVACYAFTLHHGCHAEKW
jgi:hypothetical protein